MVLEREIRSHRGEHGRAQLKKIEEILESAVSTLEDRMREEGWGAFVGISRPPRASRTIEILDNIVRKIRMLGRSESVDEFGMDPVFVDLISPLFTYLYDTYWRVEAKGVHRVPDRGRGILVANHAGLFPYDGAMIGIAVRDHHPSGRYVRFLAEDMFGTFPVIAPLLVRGGMVRACRENAERLLNKDALIGVFPEGVKGIGKLFTQRYRLQRFGRGGVITLSLRTRSPIIPVAVVGSEEIHPIIAKSDLIARILGIPFFPLTITWPWLGPLGLIPLPSKWTIVFGDPFDFHERYGPEEADNELLVTKLNEKVRETIQRMLVEILRTRKSVWFG